MTIPKGTDQSESRRAQTFSAKVAPRGFLGTHSTRDADQSFGEAGVGLPVAVGVG